MLAIFADLILQLLSCITTKRRSVAIVIATLMVVCGTILVFAERGFYGSFAFGPSVLFFVLALRLPPRHTVATQRKAHE
jgi:hypothetical protein